MAEVKNKNAKKNKPEFTTKEQIQGELFEIVKRPLGNNVVNQSNKLTECRQRLSANQNKLIYAVAGLVQPGDKDFKTYRIKIKDVIEYLDLQGKGSYKQIQETTLSLIGQTVEVWDEGGYLQTTIISSARYPKGSGYIEIRLSPEMKPYLLDLNDGRFTKASTATIGKLRSAYSIRIYLLLKQYLPIGHRQLTLNWMRERFGIRSDEYIKYANFKQKIILRAQEELSEKAEITFDFEEIKEGKKVVAIKFYIRKNQPQNTCIPLDDIEEPPSNHPFINQMLSIFEAQDIKIPIKDKQKVVDAIIELKLTEDDVQKIAYELRYQAMYGIRMAITHFLNDPKEISNQIVNNTFGINTNIRRRKAAIAK